MNAYSYEIQQINDNYNNQIWFHKKSEVPIVSGVFSFDHAGYAYDSFEKSGIAHMLSYLLQDGCVESENFLEEAESNGIIISFRVDQDFFYIAFKTMSNNLEKTIELISHAILKPKFTNKKIDLAVTNIHSFIAEDATDQKSVADKELKSAVFDKHQYSNYIYGRLDSISDISSEDVVKQAKKTFVSSKMKVSISGDTSSKQILNLFNKYMNLPSSDSTESPNIQYFNSKNISQKTNKIVDMDIKQTLIYFYMNGISLEDPNIYKMTILSHILGGGGLQSLLTEKIRKELALTYNISTKTINNVYANLLFGQASIKNGSSQIVKSEILKILKNIQVEDLNHQQLESAKAFIIGFYNYHLVKNSGFAATMNLAQRHNLGINYIKNYIDNIQSVSLDDINEFKNQHINHKNISFVEVGPSKKT